MKSGVAQIVERKSDGVITFNYAYWHLGQNHFLPVNDYWKVLYTIKIIPGIDKRKLV